MNSEKYIGLDVHQATISVAVMDSQGKIIMESILETKASTLLEFFAGLRGSLFVTFEEGTWAAWLYDSGDALASRATLSAAGHAAALAPTSATGTSGGESQTCHHCQASANSVAGTDSFRLSGGADSDSPSFSQQAPTMDLQWTGAGNPRQRGISLC